MSAGSKVSEHDLFYSSAIPYISRHIGKKQEEYDHKEYRNGQQRRNGDGKVSEHHRNISFSDELLSTPAHVEADP